MKPKILIPCPANRPSPLDPRICLQRQIKVASGELYMFDYCYGIQCCKYRKISPLIKAKMTENEIDKLVTRLKEDELQKRKELYQADRGSWYYRDEAIRAEILKSRKQVQAAYKEL
jgi:hypothetical protein